MWISLFAIVTVIAIALCVAATVMQSIEVGYPNRNSHRRLSGRRRNRVARAASQS